MMAITSAATVSTGAKRGGAPKSAPTSPGTPYVAPENPLSKLLADFGVSYPDAPAASPALLAFARGLGLNLSAAEDSRRRGIERVEARTADALDDLNRNAERGKKNLTTDLMRRGVLSSGESNTRYARQAEDVAARRSDIARTKVEGISAVEDAFETAKGGYRTQLLERTLGAETDQARDAAIAKANEETWRRQEEADALAWQRQKEANDRMLETQIRLLNGG